MKIKKIMGLVLAMVIILTSFAGCSYDELGYLKMQTNIANMDKVKVEGSTDIDLTFTKTMGELSSSLMSTLMDNDMIEAASKLSDFPIDNVTIRFEAVKDSTNNYLEYTVKLGLTGDNTLIGKCNMNFVMKDGNLYITRKSFVNILDTVVRIVDKYLGEKLTDEDLVQIKELKQRIGTEGYFELYNKEQINSMYTGYNMQMYNLENAQSINKIAIDFLMKSFGEFNSNLVYEEEDGSYTLYLDNQVVQNLIADLIEYVANNKEKVFNAYIELLRGLNEYIDFEEVYQINIEDLITLFEQEKEMIFESIDVALQMYGDEQKAMLAETMNRFDGTYYADNIKKMTSSDYNYKQYMEVYFYDLKMLGLSSNYKYSKVFSDVNQKEIKDVMTMEELIYGE